MLTLLVRLAAFAIGSFIGSWLAIDLPEIMRERRRKKNEVENAAARERDKMLRERLKERYKNDIYS